MTTREAAIAALFARLAPNGGAFKTAGRRLRTTESLPPETTPVLMLLEATERYEAKSADLPPIRRLNMRALVYCDIGTDENAIPASSLNAALDAIDAALQPDNASSRRQTLGGLVDSVVIDGTVIKAPGDVTGKSLAIVPITIRMP